MATFGDISRRGLYFWKGKTALLVSVFATAPAVTVGHKCDLVMTMGAQICHGNIWPSGALGGLIVIQQQLEAARLEPSHTPRGVVLMWALGPWDQYTIIAFAWLCQGAPISQAWGGIRSPPHPFCCSLSLERQEQLLKCLPHRFIFFSRFGCCEHLSDPLSLHLVALSVFPVFLLATQQRKASMLAFCFVLVEYLCAQCLTAPQLQLCSPLIGRIIMDLGIWKGQWACTHVIFSFFFFFLRLSHRAKLVFFSSLVYRTLNII